MPDPRIGVAVRIPKLIGWRVRFMGATTRRRRCLPSPGPSSISAGRIVLSSAARRTRRAARVWPGDPLKGWTFDSNFRTGARNFFDHDALGNSNIFFPLTLEHARIRGWELSASSPRLAQRVAWRLAYSHQYAQWNGGITGGLFTGDSCEEPLCFLDHDQRDTLSTGLNMTLPWRVWAAVGANYGSGFVNGDGPAHLPPTRRTTCPWARLSARTGACA
jgi:hypothetical protein